MSTDLNYEKGKYVEYKEFVESRRVDDGTYIFVNYQYDEEFLSQIDKIDKKTFFIIFICKEYYNYKSTKIKDIDRKLRPFWFPFKKDKAKYRHIPLFMIIELCRLIKQYKGIKLKVIASRELLIVATCYINQIFDSTIEINNPTPTLAPLISKKSIKTIKEILWGENFSSYTFFDLDNIQRINYDELHQSAQHIFVRNLKARDPNIGKMHMGKVIEVPTVHDSADIVIIVMTTFLATHRDKSAHINVKSKDKIFEKLKRYISIDKKSNKNIKIINSSSN